VRENILTGCPGVTGDGDILRGVSLGDKYQMIVVVKKDLSSARNHFVLRKN
jgi:hypothetical protein